MTENSEDKVRRNLEEGDEIEIEYDSVYTDGTVTKQVTVKGVVPLLSWEDKRSVLVKRQDGQQLYLGSHGQVVSTEEEDAGIVINEKRTIGHNASVSPLDGEESEGP